MYGYSCTLAVGERLDSDVFHGTPIPLPCCSGTARLVLARFLLGFLLAFCAADDAVTVRQDLWHFLEGDGGSGHGVP